MSYNILKGGGDRLSRIEQVMRAARPDISGVLEANNWDMDLAVKKTIFGFRHAMIAKSPSGYSMAIFTADAPLALNAVSKYFWHYPILLRINCEEVGEVAILFVHLNPQNEKVRKQEILHIARVLRSFNYSIIIGDFNSLSPHDPYNRSSLLAAFQQKNITKFGTRTLCFDAVTALEKNGFRDVAFELKKPFIPTVPTAICHDKMHAAPLRLDYAFCSTQLLPYIADYTVIVNNTTNEASDHYPIILDVNLIISK